MKLPFLKAPARILVVSISVVTLFLPVLASAAPSWGGHITVGDLNTLCISSAADAQLACQSYLIGAFEGLNAAGDLQLSNGELEPKKTDQLLCLPPAALNPSLGKTFSTYLQQVMKDQPNQANLPAIAVIAAFINYGFACPDGAVRH
jgi:hypothetical protein